MPSLRDTRQYSALFPRYYHHTSCDHVEEDEIAAAAAAQLRPDENV